VSHFLMCPPDYFGIEYEINPWMRLSNRVNPAMAAAQWKELNSVLKDELGARIELMEPVKGLPDLVFTANAGFVEGQTFISSSFKFKERQGETPYFDTWFQSHGFQIARLGPQCIFEGAGDALRLGENIIAGYRHRSEICSHKALGGITGRRVISLELTDPFFYHLDTCFCPLDESTALYFPHAFDNYAVTALKEIVERLQPVSDVSARQFACNAVVIDGTVVTNAGCADLEEPLATLGYRMRPVELSEFIKSGGSARCLTLRLD